jgi:hypothetical protein
MKSSVPSGVLVVAIAATTMIDGAIIQVFTLGTETW